MAQLKALRRKLKRGFKKDVKKLKRKTKRLTAPQRLRVKIMRNFRG
jgi:hypothetical protein